MTTLFTRIQSRGRVPSTLLIILCSNGLHFRCFARTKSGDDLLGQVEVEESSLK
ncbi:hypothetical protein [Streptomyces sp. NPDC026673]|uniref:hypothetical protein n=1 Tax=Streptomyces sp. NPDC026673 TaxID=3155724 RepID=UPI0033E14854